MRGRPTLVLGLLGLVTICSALGTAGRLRAATLATPSAADTISVTGLVSRPYTLSAADLNALPSETVSVTWHLSDRTTEHHAFRGPRLYDLLEHAQPTAEIAATPDMRQQGQEEPGRTSVLATASDAFEAVVAWGEIDPQLSNQPIILAWEMDGQPLPGQFQPAYLVIPSDAQPARAAYAVVRLEVRNPESRPAGTPHS